MTSLLFGSLDPQGKGFKAMVCGNTRNQSTSEAMSMDKQTVGMPNAKTLNLPVHKGTLMGTPNREPQEYSRNIIGIYLPVSLYSIVFLLYSWRSLFGVPIITLLVLASASTV